MSLFFTSLLIIPKSLKNFLAPSLINSSLTFKKGVKSKVKPFSIALSVFAYQIALITYATYEIYIN